MATAQDVQLNIQANNSASAAFQEIIGQLTSMQGGVGQVTSAFASLTPAIAGVTALLGGGAAFAGSVSAFLDLAAGVKQLETRFGMSADAASNMSTQLKIVGISTDDYTSMAFKLDKQIKSNETGINALGVATRDENGHLLDQKTLLGNAASAMMQYEAGTNRNEVAMRLFGKSGSDAMALLKLNEATAIRAAELTSAYGLALDDVSLKKAKDYKIAMNEVKLAGESIASHVGQALVPGLTDLANAFTNIAIDAMPTVNTAISTGGMFFTGFGETIASVVNSAETSISGFSGFVNKTFNDDVPKSLDNSLTGTQIWAAGIYGTFAGIQSIAAVTGATFEKLGVLAAGAIGVVRAAESGADPATWMNSAEEASRRVAQINSTLAADQATIIMNLQSKVWPSIKTTTDALADQKKHLGELGNATAKTSNDAVISYNKQVDAFNALYDENVKTDAAMKKVQATTLTVQQADENLTAALQNQIDIRKITHDLNIQGVQDGVDYVDWKKKEEAANKLVSQSQSDSNKVHSEATRLNEELQKAVAANIIQNGQLVPGVMSVKDAQSKANTALSEWNTLSISGTANIGDLRAAQDKYKLSLDDVKAAENNLKVSTTAASNAITDAQACYVAFGGTANTKVTAVSTAVQNMNGDLRTTLNVGIAAGQAIGGAFGDSVSKILSVVQAVNSVCSALNSVSSLANTAGQALGLVTSAKQTSVLLSGGNGVGGSTSDGSYTPITYAADGSVVPVSSDVLGTGLTGGQLIGGAAGTYGLVKSVENGGAGGALGGALSGASIGSIIPGVGTVVGGVIGGILGLFSDPRVKENITPVGVTAHGLPLYDFSYKGDQTHQMYEGVMSTDVSKVMPSAVHKFGDIDTVDYSALGISMKKVQGFADGGAFAGGLRLVGERGPELEVTGPSRIYSNKDTASMLDNSEVVSSLADMKKLLFAHINMAGDQKVLTEKMYNIFDRVTQGGTTLRTKAA